jgi:hypothetical protein
MRVIPGWPAIFAECFIVRTRSRRDAGTNHRGGRLGFDKGEQHTATAFLQTNKGLLSFGGHARPADTYQEERAREFVQSVYPQAMCLIGSAVPLTPSKIRMFHTLVAKSN